MVISHFPCLDILGSSNPIDNSSIYENKVCCCQVNNKSVVDLP